MIWPIVSSDASIIIQGMTGKEGTRMAAWMIGSGTNVVAGVTPGKGGQVVLDKPIFDSVAEAKQKFPDVLATCVVVPAERVLSAAVESIAQGLKLIYILTEKVPVQDVMRLRDAARASGAIILGPSSVGMLQFPKFRLGYLGGERPFDYLREGGSTSSPRSGVALLSASGGMANEILMSFAREEIGIKIALALGGDRVQGFTLAEAVAMCENMDGVGSLALFIEPGHPFLRRLASGDVKMKKPATVMLPGSALELLPRGLPYGHAGTILGEDDQPLAQIRSMIRARGIACAETMGEFLQLCKSAK